MNDAARDRDLTKTLLTLGRARGLVREARRGEWGETSVFNLTDSVLRDLTRMIEALESSRLQSSGACEEGAPR